MNEDLMLDSGDKFLEELDKIALEDVEGLRKAKDSYGNSWKRRGGVSAFMNLDRKWDRLEEQCQKHGFDIFKALAHDERPEGVIDDIRDLRRYLMLVEAEARARGHQSVHRDNMK